MLLNVPQDRTYAQKREVCNRFGIVPKTFFPNCCIDERFFQAEMLIESFYKKSLFRFSKDYFIDEQVQDIELEDFLQNYPSIRLSELQGSFTGMAFVDGEPVLVSKDEYKVLCLSFENGEVVEYRSLEFLTDQSLIFRIDSPIQIEMGGQLLESASVDLFGSKVWENLFNEDYNLRDIVLRTNVPDIVRSYCVVSSTVLGSAIQKGKGEVAEKVSLVPIGRFLVNGYRDLDYVGLFSPDFNAGIFETDITHFDYIDGLIESFASQNEYYAASLEISGVHQLNLIKDTTGDIYIADLNMGFITKNKDEAKRFFELKGVNFSRKMTISLMTDTPNVALTNLTMQVELLFDSLCRINGELDVPLFLRASERFTHLNIKKPDGTLMQEGEGVSGDILDGSIFVNGLGLPIESTKPFVKIKQSMLIDSIYSYHSDSRNFDELLFPGKIVLFEAIDGKRGVGFVIGDKCLVMLEDILLRIPFMSQAQLYKKLNRVVVEYQGQPQSLDL